MEEELRIERKKAKKEFQFVALGLILYEFMFQFVTFGVDFIEMTLLLFMFEDIQWEQASEVIYNSGIGLSFGSVVGTIVIGLVLRQAPSFREKEKISMKILIMFYILMQGLQLLSNFILIPMDLIASQMGYDFEEAISVASGTSELFSAFVYSVIVAPIVEEILCRGIIMSYLEKYGKAFAVFITAMLFGLLHQNIVQFPITMLIGVLFGYLAQRYSLGAAIALHVLNNFSVELVGLLGEKYYGVLYLDMIFLYFCIFASIFILWRKRSVISAFLKDKKSDMPVVKWFFTAPLMLLLIIYFVIFTINSVTAI